MSELIQMGQIGQDFSQMHESPRWSAGLGRRASQSLRLALDSRLAPGVLSRSIEAYVNRSQESLLCEAMAVRFTATISLKTKKISCLAAWQTGVGCGAECPGARRWGQNQMG